MEANPYEAPRIQDDALERRIASLLLEARERGMTFGSLYRKQARGYAALGVALAVGSAYFSWLKLQPAAFMMAGALVGVLLRDFGMARKQVRAWKIQQKLMDWEKVQSMAAGEPVGGAEKGHGRSSRIPAGGG